MTESVALAGASFIALLLGLLIGWLAARSRAGALALAAAAEAKAGMQIEVATLTERASTLTSSLQAERDQHAALRRMAEGWRTELDAASNEIATLTERASRVGGFFDAAHRAVGE